MSLSKLLQFRKIFDTAFPWKAKKMPTSLRKFCALVREIFFPGAGVNFPSLTACRGLETAQEKILHHGRWTYWLAIPVCVTCDIVWRVTFRKSNFAEIRDTWINAYSYGFMRWGKIVCNCQSFFVKVENINNLRIHIDVAFMPFDDLA